MLLTELKKKKKKNRKRVLTGVYVHAERRLDSQYRL